MNKKGAIEWLGKEVMNIVIGVIILVALIYLGTLIYNWASDSNDLKKANAELNAISLLMDDSFTKTTEKSYLFSTLKDWFLISTEQGTRCNGDFCLCLCKGENCDKGILSCVATKNFVLLREKDPFNCQENFANTFVEVRKIKTSSNFNPAVNLKIKYSDEKVYPFNGELSPLQISEGKINRYYKPIFFKFNEEMIWSFDLENWQSIKQPSQLAGNDVSYNNCENGYSSVDSINSQFFNQLNSADIIGQKQLLNSAKVKLSDGVFIIEK
ncbi:MAG: hypothetical protein WC781_02925 [Candidatus Pacearchaeota archaeon]|jgi:hypothetical protein